MYVPACLGMYVRCLTKYCVILSSFAGACTLTTKPGRILFSNVGERDAESSGQSPRYTCWARDFRLWISIKGKETWRQQFESAPGYFILYIVLLLNSICPLYCWACLLNLFWHLAKLFEIFYE